MPVRWTIDHAEKLVEVAVEGETSRDDAAGFLDAIEAEQAIPYRKLLDCTLAAPRIDEPVMAFVGARIAAYRNPGPIAVIVPASGPIDGLARLFLLVVEIDNTRARVFRAVAEGRQWLEARRQS
ncbi:MAG TPA: hypothetical protein VFB13_11235 [Reyranella sp.]|jgi:hypothetical protein|nr:hypothetical protein [Reyranella sp.]